MRDGDPCTLDDGNQKGGDWAGEQAHDAGQAIAHPVEGLKGAAKGIGNMPGDLWNLVRWAPRRRPAAR